MSSRFIKVGQTLINTSSIRKIYVKENFCSRDAYYIKVEYHRKSGTDGCTDSYHSGDQKTAHKAFKKLAKLILNTNKSKVN